MFHPTGKKAINKAYNWLVQFSNINSLIFECHKLVRIFVEENSWSLCFTLNQITKLLLSELKSLEDCL